ncbi:rod-binding protein [Methylobacterium oryzihabitans]|uniref:Flagellar biosynthesis protein FlgJ n=1 Tax=Methylobacterium oryzihabitans TaxID=2499852 RepID=A0A437PDB6_9HYPH|nr:rod-binding protein [Methylobacterium oryzihabitans]RVU20267.1 flagellar biosynthesis protein FlgJ [Methylobacterium oryzihabitans]
MSIKPLSDIVLDVARAADPARYQEAASRLSTTGTAGTFDDAIREAGLSTHMPSDARGTLTTLQNGAATAGPGAKAGGPYKQFEAFVLQNFIESMLPKNATAVFGKGTAGSYWKSMMAEQVSGQITRAGGLGIARILAAGRPAGETAAVAGTVAGSVASGLTTLKAGG